MPEDYTYATPMTLGDKKANAALEEHLQWMIRPEPDAVWEYLRPAKAKPSTWIEKLRAWSDVAGQEGTVRRPCNARLLLEMRTNYLDLLDAYDTLRDKTRRFPELIYTKRQLANVQSALRAVMATHYEENLWFIREAIESSPYRKAAGDVPDKLILGVPTDVVTKALIYWCLKQGEP